MARTGYMGNSEMAIGFETVMRGKNFSGVGVEGDAWKEAA